MKYNIKYYSLEKAKKREAYFHNKPIFSSKGVDSNKIFFDYILSGINLFKKNKSKIKILDIGTGTGYVPQVLCALSKEKFEITGIDLAKGMIQVAEEKRGDERIKYLIADNNKLPFKNESFDIVTNKLSTRFSMREVYRVLKKNGLFVFKEYGRGKGFMEISKMFKTRYKKNITDIDAYIGEISELGFASTTINLYQQKRAYGRDEIRDIFSMANLIDKFTEKDLVRITDKLMKNGTIEVMSDPFIICAKK